MKYFLFSMAVINGIVSGIFLERHVINPKEEIPVVRNIYSDNYRKQCELKCHKKFDSNLSGIGNDGTCYCQ